MKLKFFYKGYFRQNKGCFIVILTKIKSKLTSNSLIFYGIPVMKDDGIKGVQQILSQ